MLNASFPSFSSIFSEKKQGNKPCYTYYAITVPEN